MPVRKYCLLLSLLFTALVHKNANAQSAREVLLKGIDSLPMPPEDDGVGFFSTVNERPEILATVDLNLNVKMRGIGMMTSTLGKGKVVAVGSVAYLQQAMLKDDNVAGFWKNVLQWAGAGKKGIRVALTQDVDDPALKNFLRTRKAKPYTLDQFELKKNTDVVILATDLSNDIHQKKLERFVTEGGTLILASPYSNYGKERGIKGPVVTNFAMEPLLAKMGVGIVSILAKRYTELTKLRTDSIPDYLHINTLLPRLIATPDNEFTRNIYYYFMYPTLQLVFRYNKSRSQVKKNIRQFFDIPDTLNIPSPQRPWVIRSEKQKTAARLAYMIFEAEHNTLDAKMPGHEVFPGSVPASAQRIGQTFNIPVKVGKHGLVEPPPVYDRPHSTGLYVPAGEVVTITLSPEMAKQGLTAQVGVHKDELFNIPQITRIPLDLTRRFGIRKERTTVFSPYGGLLLINVPDTSKLKNISIKVDGAVKAPYFKLGETTEAEWNAVIRNNPAPWAELATDNVVLTVPSYRIRELRDPVKLMRFWDDVLNADADLAIVSRKRAYQERIIIDSDLSIEGAYMFCDYDRIVAPDDGSCALMLDESALLTKGSWGHFHELGHRHQFQAFDFEGLGEVTTNLYTTYVYDKVLHKGLYNHDAIPNKAAAIKKIKAYMHNHPTYEKWCRDPFLALSMYIQIVEAFGWDALKAVHTVYRNTPKDQYPKNEQEKRDRWFINICKVTKSDMSRFFDVWKVPVSDAAKLEVKEFKVWFPKELE